MDDSKKYSGHVIGGTIVGWESSSSKIVREFLKDCGVKETEINQKSFDDFEKFIGMPFSLIGWIDDKGRFCSEFVTHAGSHRCHTCVEWVNPNTYNFGDRTRAFCPTCGTEIV